MAENNCLEELDNIIKENNEIIKKAKEYHIDGDGNPIHFEPVKVDGVKKAYRIVEGLLPSDISYSEKRKKIRKQRKAKKKLLKKQRRK